MPPQRRKLSSPVPDPERPHQTSRSILRASQPKMPSDKECNNLGWTATTAAPSVFWTPSSIAYLPAPAWGQSRAGVRRTVPFAQRTAVSNSTRRLCRGSLRPSSGTAILALQTKRTGSSASADIHKEIQDETAICRRCSASAHDQRLYVGLGASLLVVAAPIFSRNAPQPATATQPHLPRSSGVQSLADRIIVI
jgi:hypothetical protein